MPIRALIVHPKSDYNSGDLLTYYGTCSLLTEAAGGSQNIDFVQFDMERSVRELDTYASQFNWGRIDLVVLGGSPWVWHQCEGSAKGMMLGYIVRRFGNVPKIGLGLGSCMPYDVHKALLAGQPEHWIDHSGGKWLNSIYGQFDAIYTRDYLAHVILKRAGVNTTYWFDTSLYYCHAAGPQRGGRKILWFYDPSKGVSKSRQLTWDRDKYIQYQLDWADANGAEIYCNSDADLATLMELGREANFTVDLEHTAARMARCDEILSGRVHMAVLAHLVGVPKIALLPVDSRFLTLKPLDIGMHWVGQEWPNAEVPIIADDKGTYKRAELVADLQEIIKKAIKLAQQGSD